MLKTTLLHPDILSALAKSGHFSQVLIADGNYPAASRSSPRATKVYLNLMPGTVKTTEVLEALLSAIVVQEAVVMQLPPGEEAPVLDQYVRMLPAGMEMRRLERYAFYDAAGSDNITLVILTGDTRRFANILLTIGVVRY